MGCCGDEDDDDDLFHQPLISGTTTDAGETAGIVARDTASSMNSNFSAIICRDTLRIIFEKLPIADLARAACVCRLWCSIAGDREIQTAAFKAPWKLKEIVGNPSSGSFWRDNSLSKFAISHRLVRGDSVARLAVKYSVQVLSQSRSSVSLITLSEIASFGFWMIVVSIILLCSGYEQKSRQV